MIRYLYGVELDRHPKLAHSMFRDRAWQFKERLDWAVSVTPEGEERDEYDFLNPLYVIWENRDGTHGGSMRLLPTVGQTMVNDHFGHLTGGGPIQSPLIWECTRFCLSPTSTARTAAALMLAGGEVMQGFGVEHYVGVFDARMVRIYRRIGSSPEILGTDGTGRDAISVGLWDFTPAARTRVAMAAGLSTRLSRHWFTRAFGADFQLARTA
ncbi:acyl-homoserine-lactone synthase [Pseudaestuariivita atlantica]|uniref:Acyl-homoserine-lactone synthase n=1 Tax=Pseudaestuariivita atlantica TaxID=1317121 RepID=A0A0L1JSJ1_9RHOB|nr:acyl-homoserine-lactone synthase [Pseudaestuariivita atlantica]KNG94363.1 autoinducer synthase [Pseudaestuariivita atlantica]